VRLADVVLLPMRGRVRLTDELEQTTVCMWSTLFGPDDNTARRGRAFFERQIVTVALTRVSTSAMGLPTNVAAAEDVSGLCSR
jgi:hypothetical protein